MRTTIQLLLTAALPVILTAGTIPIGVSTTPIVFTPSGGSAGTIAIGSPCMTSTCLGGAYNKSGFDFTWTLTSNGTLEYSGGPVVFGLSGNTSSFTLIDPQTDSLSGTVAWDSATLGTATTDINGTLTLGTVNFASPTDLLALAATEALGFLPKSGEAGSIDLVVSCGKGPCITTTDPNGIVLNSAITLNTPISTPVGSVPEPGTLLLPGLVLGVLALRKRYAV